MSETIAAAMTSRAEACFREIQQLASAERAVAGIGAYVDRASVLTRLRLIKARAAEAEILLRTRLRQELAGSSSSRAPGASPLGDAVSNPTPAPSPIEVSHG